jgi:hypothetical protein
MPLRGRSQCSVFGLVRNNEVPILGCRFPKWQPSHPGVATDWPDSFESRLANGENEQAPLVMTNGACEVVDLGHQAHCTSDREFPPPQPTTGHANTSHQ